MGFKSPAQVCQRPHEDQWRLVSPLIYEGRDDVFVIAQGFVSDLASIPRPLQWLVPRSASVTSAVILHDALRARLRQARVDGGEPAPFTARDADGIFRAAMREAGVSVVRRRAVYWAVRAAGAFELRDRSRCIGSGAALAAGALLGAGALVPVGAYLIAFGAVEVTAYVTLQVVWRHQPRRLVGVPWPFAARRRRRSGGTFLTVHPKADAATNKAVRIVVHADELPLQLPVPAPAAGPLDVITPEELPAEAVALCLQGHGAGLRAPAPIG
jgi:hypothetical protein